MLQRSPRRPNRRTTRILLLVALSAAAVGLTVWVSNQGPTVYNIATLLAALASLIVTVVEPLRGTPAPRDPAALADDLALLLGEEWIKEARARRLRDPRVLPLAWTTTSRDVADTLRTGPNDSLVLRPRLDGRLEGRFEEATARLAEGYDRVPNRRLVVVGEPGSGKTVLALLLTLGLLDAREDGGPVPVLLPVSSWDPLRERLDDWIVRTMARPYYNGRPEIPRTLLDHDLILPVLDGLDEIPESARRSAIRAINQAIGADRPIVVTCRAVEYEELIRGGAPTMRQAAVVEVSPVTPEDAITYLRGVEWPAGTDWTPVFTHLRTAPDSPLSKALSTPLMVTSARLVYEKGGGDPAELLDSNRFDSEYAIEDHLLHGMLDAAYAPDPNAPEDSAPRERWSPEQARRWLTFLARHLHEHRERDLEWWKLSGRLLSPWAGALVGLCLGAVLALAVFPILLVTELAGDDSTMDVLLSLGLGAAFALLNSLVWPVSADRPPGRLIWSPRGSAGRLFRRFRTGAGLMALFMVPGVIFFIVGGLVRGDPPHPELRGVQVCAEGIGIGVALSVAGGLALAAAGWLDAPPARAAQVSPLRLLTQDRRSSVFSAVAAGVVASATGLPACWVGLVSGDMVLRLLTGEAGWPGHLDMTWALARLRWDELTGLTPKGYPGFVYAYLMPGVLFAMVLLMSRAWPRLLVVKTWLALRGRLPWRFMAFLADARDREVLRQAGGAYQFRHIRLQETLAGEPVYRDETESRQAEVRRRAVLAFGIGSVAVGMAGTGWRFHDMSEDVFADPLRQPVMKVGFLPSPSQGREEEVAYVLDVGSGGTRLWTRGTEGRTTLSWAKGGGYVLSKDAGKLRVGKDHQAVENLLDLSPSTSMAVLPTARSPLFSGPLVAFDPTRRRLADGGAYQSVDVWQVTSVRHGLPVGLGAGTTLVLPDANERRTLVQGLTFLSDGSLVVISNEDAWLYPAPNFSERKRWPLPHNPTGLPLRDAYYGIATSNALMLSPSGKLLLVLGPKATGCWAVASGGLASFRWQVDSTAAAAFSPDGSLLAMAGAGSHANDIQLYDLSSPQVPRKTGSLLRGHMAPVSALAFNAGGTLLVSGDNEGTLRIWDVKKALN